MNKDVVGGLILLCLAGAYYWATRQIADSSLSDEVGAQGLPTILGFLLAGLAVLIMARGALARPRPVAVAAEPGGCGCATPAGAGPSRHRRRLRRPGAAGRLRRRSRLADRVGGRLRGHDAVLALGRGRDRRRRRILAPLRSAPRAWSSRRAGSSKHGRSRQSPHPAGDHARGAGCLGRTRVGHRRRRLPGISSSITMALILPLTYTHRPGVGGRPPRDDLYRRGIRRLHPGDPDPHAGHQLGRRHGHRRLRDEAARARRRGARHLALVRRRRQPVRPRHADPDDASRCRAWRCLFRPTSYCALGRARPQHHRLACPTARC